MSKLLSIKRTLRRGTESPVEVSFQCAIVRNDHYLYFRGPLADKKLQFYLVPKLFFTLSNRNRVSAGTGERCHDLELDRPLIFFVATVARHVYMLPEGHEESLLLDMSEVVDDELKKRDVDNLFDSAFSMELTVKYSCGCRDGHVIESKKITLFINTYCTSQQDFSLQNNLDSL